MKKPTNPREVFLDFDPVFPGWSGDVCQDEMTSRHPHARHSPTRPCPHTENEIGRVQHDPRTCDEETTG